MDCTPFKRVVGYLGDLEKVSFRSTNAKIFVQRAAAKGFSHEYMTYWSFQHLMVKRNSQFQDHITVTTELLKSDSIQNWNMYNLQKCVEFTDRQKRRIHV